jgi:hypothetical protein
LVVAVVDSVQPQLKLAGRVVVVEQSEVLETMPVLLELLGKETRAVAVVRIVPLIDFPVEAVVQVRRE